MATPDKGLKTVLVSGGFDPFHDGHAELIENASKVGRVVVALNSDAWLVRKKGRAFMPYEARRKVMESIKGVIFVYPVEDEDGTVCEAVRSLRPDYFANGGDRTSKNTPESKLCVELGIELLYDMGKKVNSSSELVNRDWGHYEVLYEDIGFKVKLLTVNPHSQTSLQSHNQRAEHWIYPHGDKYTFVPVGEKHILKNETNKVLQVVEVQTGVCDEGDILRYT